MESIGFSPQNSVSKSRFRWKMCALCTIEVCTVYSVHHILAKNVSNSILFAHFVERHTIHLICVLTCSTFVIVKESDLSNHFNQFTISSICLSRITYPSSRRLKRKLSQVPKLRTSFFGIAKYNICGKYVFVIQCSVYQYQEGLGWVEMRWYA